MAPSACPPALLVFGPTGSGKSILAINLAHKLNGAVINADSVQVYRDLPILSARPSVQEMGTIPHYLFGHIDGERFYSVQQWIQEINGIFLEIRAKGQIPIFVGGTGLYFKALTQGLTHIPEIPEKIRKQVRNQAQQLAPAALHARLTALDPVMGQRLKPTDPQRIARALEIIQATGKSMAYFLQQPRVPFFPSLTPQPDSRKENKREDKPWRAYFLSPPREMLRNKINDRFDHMMSCGGLEEAQRLYERHLPMELPLMRAHGLIHLISYFKGLASLEEATEKAKAETRQYAKRQFTWARHQLDYFIWVEPEKAYSLILQHYEEKVLS